MVKELAKRHDGIALKRITMIIIQKNSVEVKEENFVSLLLF